MGFSDRVAVVPRHVVEELATAAYGVVRRLALVRAGGLLVRRREQVLTHVEHRYVVAHGQPGLEEQRRRVGVGDRLAVDGDAHVARAGEDVDPLVRVARMHVDLLVLLVPRIELVPVEGDVAGEVRGLGIERDRVAPDRVLLDLAAHLERPVDGIALVGAVRAVAGRLEELHAHVVHGKVVDRGVARLAQEQRTLRVDDRLAAREHADPLRARLHPDVVVGVADAACCRVLRHRWPPWGMSGRDTRLSAIVALPLDACNRGGMPAAQPLRAVLPNVVTADRLAVTAPPRTAGARRSRRCRRRRARRRGWRGGRSASLSARWPPRAPPAQPHAGPSCRARRAR